MFNYGYSGAEPTERVKYGTLNISNDPSGVVSCRQYGDSLLILRNETVRHRTTFSDGDTARPRIMGTKDHYAHILTTFSDIELGYLISIAKKKGYTDNWISSASFSMRESQIHGHIKFDSDVEAISVSRRHNTDSPLKVKIQTFCEKYGITMILGW